MASKPRAVCVLLVSLALFQGAVHGRLTASDQLEPTYSNSLHWAAPSPQTDKPLVDVITDGIEKITNLTDTLRKDIEKINNFNAPKLGGKVVQGITSIIKTVIEVSTALVTGKWEALDDDDAQKVVVVLVQWAQVQEGLSNILVVKHDLVGFIPFIEPIRLVLVQTEVVEGTFTFNLLNVIPTQQFAASEQVASLKVSIHTAVETYSVSLFQTALRKQPFESLIKH